MLQYQLKMEDAPILRLLDSIITEGLVSGTSDIHLEPGTEYDRIRYRIDGVLQQVQRLPMERHTALVSCVKLMAGMDIAEKRKPQDGRAQVSHENKKVDLRVSSLPTVLGEKIVIRVLDSDTSRLRLEDMDFTTNNLALYRDMYKSSYGLVLVTGPTGSGKTTTLYATLQELNRPERNIVTVEDPVEYCMEGLKAGPQYYYDRGDSRSGNCGDFYSGCIDRSSGVQHAAYKYCGRGSYSFAGYGNRTVSGGVRTTGDCCSAPGAEAVL